MTSEAQTRDFAVTLSLNHQLQRAQDDGPHAQAERSEAHGWIVIAAASAVLFVGVGYTNTFGVFQDYYEQSLFPDRKPSEIIVIGSVASSLYLILGVFTGRFADLIGYRVSLIIGSVMMIGSLFAASVASKFWQFLLSQGVAFGLGLSFAYMPATTVSRQYFGSSKHGLANGIVVSGGALGGCILPYIVRILLNKYGLPRTFQTLGYLAIGILGPSIFFLEPKKSSRDPSNQQRQPFIDVSLLGDVRFIALIVSLAIAMTGFLPRYFLIPASAQTQGISRSYAAWLVGIMNGLSIVGRVGIGWMADRRGKVNALAASFVLCGLGHFAFWLPGVSITPASNEKGAIALFTLFVIFIGIFGSGFISLFPVVVAHLFGPFALASKVGLLNTAAGLGSLAGPSAVYAIIGDEGPGGHWTTGVLSSGLFLFIGGVILAGSMESINKLEQRHRPRDDIRIA